LPTPQEEHWQPYFYIFFFFSISFYFFSFFFYIIMRNFSLVKACISTATSSSSTIFHTSHSFYHILHGNYATEVAVFIYNERDVLLLFQHLRFTVLTPQIQGIPICMTSPYFY